MRHRWLCRARRAQALLRHHGILLGGRRAAMQLIDLNRMSIVQQYDAPDGAMLMRRGRYLCCATTAGAVQLRDPKSMRVVRLRPPTAMVVDRDVAHRARRALYHSHRRSPLMTSTASRRHRWQQR